MGSIESESVPAAFELTVVDGHELLSWRAPPPQPTSSSPDGWGEVDALYLATAAPNRAAAGSTGGESGASTPAQFQNRRFPLFRATIVTTAHRLSAALRACPLADFGIEATRVWLTGAGPRLSGLATVGTRQAPFTIRVATEPRSGGRRGLRVSLADVRLFAHLPLPAPLVGAAIARAIVAATSTPGLAVRVHGPMLDIDPLQLALIPALVARGWRLPDLRRAWLESVRLSDGDLRIQFESEGSPTDRVTTLDRGPPTGTMACVEGEPLPETLAAAEELLFAGDLVAAEAAYRTAAANAPGERGPQVRLLAVCAATGAPDAALLGAALIAEWPDFLPGVLYAASGALEAGDLASAERLFDRVALLADARGESEDAELARAAAASARRQTSTAGASTPLVLAAEQVPLAPPATDELAILNPRQIEALPSLAEIALDRGELAAAAERLQEVLRLLPPDALESILEVRERLSEIHAEMGNWGVARHFVQLVLAQDPGRLSSLERLVEINLHLGQYAAAADACSRLARLNMEPRERAAALFRRGEILRESLGDEEAAFDAYLKSSDLDPTLASTALRLIEAYWRRGDFSDAAAVGEDLRRVGALPAMEAPVRLRLALATALAGGDAARGYAAAELAVIPFDPDAAALALVETADRLSDRPPHEIEPAAAVLEAWQGGPTTDPLEEVLRAWAAANPAAAGIAPALAWLRHRKQPAIAAREPPLPDDSGA